MSTTTRETTTIHPTESSSPIGATQASTLAVHLGLNLHTALLAGGFILLLALICGMAVALLCFLKKVRRLEERQAPMEMQPVITSFRNDAYRASAGHPAARTGCTRG
ncbi:hypothetical protein DdX_16190 [Ditylenchus destructor]|uniref:Uncharacterized protein n=1 Tax=Ditylenchus destructor TaxID=166010 RepID=A0AAD4MQT8_9BILA|nr:hypothetical protein DdX_16190 [Ditylenchus destructor]